MKTILSVVGARPNFMKVGPLHRAFQRYHGTVSHRIVHTGQHYDRQMSRVFFEDLELPKPDVYLGVGSGTHAEQTAKVMVEFERVMEAERPDLVIVVGDVNSTLACSIVSAKLSVPVAHVEAGLRSSDRSMPEEINRLVTDAISDYLFVSEPSGVRNLRHEGIDDGKIFFVGNVMIDSLVHFLEKARHSKICQQFALAPKSYALVTLHRPSNVDAEERFGEILDLLEALARETVVIFPVHPRTRKRIDEFGFANRIATNKNLKLLDPVGYLDFLKLMEDAALVVTDSGGIQEETTYLGIPCKTLRENTERPVTTEIGTNELCGSDLRRARDSCLAVLHGNGKKGSIPELWDGKAAERIVEFIMRASS